MNRFDFVKNYQRLVKQLIKTRPDYQSAMELAVGGDFKKVGCIERDLLIQCGLEAGSYLVDVGCGSGRLAAPISQYLTRGKYLGTDVVTELLQYARKNMAHPQFRFEVVNGLTIPEKDEQADFVCFFSVFTHLLHEESYRYLTEAKRVLKPGGKIVFSFLEFAMAQHWVVFEADCQTIGMEKPLNMFIGRDAIPAWAEHLGLHVDAIYGGDEAFIRLSEPIEIAGGETIRDFASMWQSVCVLSKPAS